MGIFSSYCNAQVEVNFKRDGKVYLNCNKQEYLFDSVEEFCKNFNDCDNYLHANSIVQSVAVSNAIIFKRIYSKNSQLCNLIFRNDEGNCNRLVFTMHDTKPLIFENCLHDDNIELSMYNSTADFIFKSIRNIHM